MNIRTSSQPATSFDIATATNPEIIAEAVRRAHELVPPVSVPEHNPEPGRYAGWLSVPERMLRRASLGKARGFIGRVYGPSSYDLVEALPDEAVTTLGEKLDGLYRHGGGGQLVSPEQFTLAVVGTCDNSTDSSPAYVRARIADTLHKRNPFVQLVKPLGTIALESAKADTLRHGNPHRVVMGLSPSSQRLAEKIDAFCESAGVPATAAEAFEYWFFPEFACTFEPQCFKVVSALQRGVAAAQATDLRLTTAQITILEQMEVLGPQEAAYPLTKDRIAKTAGLSGDALDTTLIAVLDSIIPQPAHDKRLRVAKEFVMQCLTNMVANNAAFHAHVLSSSPPPPSGDTVNPKPAGTQRPKTTSRRKPPVTTSQTPTAQDEAAQSPGAPSLVDKRYEPTVAELIERHVMDALRQSGLANIADVRALALELGQTRMTGNAQKYKAAGGTDNSDLRAAALLIVGEAIRQKVPRQVKQLPGHANPPV